MKAQIRRGMFETNSSSVHSVCIMRNYSYIPEFLTLPRGEFGWEDECYSLCSDKAAYFHEALLAVSENEKEYNEYKSKFNEIFEEYHIDTVWQDVVYNGNYPEFEGYIDHGYELKPWLEKLLEDPDLLLGFLFNPDSCVVTGNDNHYPGDENASAILDKYDYEFDKGN